MEIWILIIGLYLRGDGGGVSAVQVEFNSKANCEEAGRKMAKEWGRGAITFVDQSRWVCVRK